MPYLCVPLFSTCTTYTTITTTIIVRSIFFFAYSLFVCNKICSLHLHSRDLSHAMILHTKLTELLLLVVCFMLTFYSPTQQSDERFWSRMFVFSLSRELHCDFIFVCVLCTHCLLLHLLTLRFRYLSLSYSYWFTYM